MELCQLKSEQPLPRECGRVRNAGRANDSVATASHKKVELELSTAPVNAKESQEKQPDRIVAEREAGNQLRKGTCVCSTGIWRTYSREGGALTERCRDED